MFAFQGTVAELTGYIRDLFEGDVKLADVTVTGEISNFTRAASGHWYFTIKDEGAQIRCAMWRSAAERQPYQPKNGDAVTAHGRVSVYEPRGEYQLYADRVRPAGMGDLYAQFEALKARLEADGLFDAARKRPIPAVCWRIGVVTSADAAAFQDVLHVLAARFPMAEVILSATPVQGEAAPPQIAAALERLNRYAEPDVILLCRGGGSIEDLWAFNDERVARAVAASRVPVIAGVGHETDFTIADFVADLRAPTPSAAAALATPITHDDLGAAVRGMDQRLRAALADRVDGLAADLRDSQRALGHVSPGRALITLRQRVDEWDARLARLARAGLERRRERLTARDSALHAASPQSILARGYAIVTRADGALVRRAADVAPGDPLDIRLQDGVIRARRDR